MHGFAPTTRAVKALSEAGVTARTVASLLENKLPSQAQGKELWIIDESSLLATRQVNRLLRKAREASVERIVFVGDQRQHHAIEAGRPVYQMQQAGMRVAQLETIRRQRDPNCARRLSTPRRRDCRCARAPRAAASHPRDQRYRRCATINCRGIRRRARRQESACWS